MLIVLLIKIILPKLFFAFFFFSSLWFLVKAEAVKTNAIIGAIAIFGLLFMFSSLCGVIT